MKVISIENNKARVEIEGVTQTADISLVDARVGDYVIIHAGFAISKLDESEAQKTLNLLSDMQETTNNPKGR